jgi:XTP/dITP diphosphohydrolase
VRSARYASEEATDEENNKLLLQTMKFQVKRTCRFRCALAVAAPNGKILLETLYHAILYAIITYAAA